LFVCTRHEEECSLLILVDAMHFLKHCPLVSVADKWYIYLFPFQFITWTACFPGSDTGRIEMRFLSTVPWCLLQLFTVLSSNIWCFTTWAACFAGSDTGRIKIQFLSTVPWCLLQLSNRIHVVHSSTIRCTLLLYINPCLSSGRAAKHSPLAVTCYHLNS